MSGLFMKFFPSFQQNLLIFVNDTKDFWDFVRGKSVVFCENERAEPEFGFKIVAGNVDVRRLSRFSRVKVKSVGAAPQNGWHGEKCEADIEKMNPRPEFSKKLAEGECKINGRR